MSTPSKAKSEVQAKTTTPVAGSQLRAISPADFTNVRINRSMLRQVILSYQANQRRGLASTKTRGLVRGGGRKPWRQKGTGRARTGSIRNPIWRGGGTIFGPSSRRNHSQAIPGRLKQQALAAALYIQAKANKLKILRMEAPITKAKDVAKLYPQVLILRKVLLVVPDASLRAGFSNFPNICSVLASRINALDVMAAHNIIFVNDAYDKVKGRI
ncbi:50S ribosomal protein L4 [candidate division Kazan bacterium]|uniref:Large ribosomal subunit protein uL4 n=1 Tax=candidate division Kazan bacterium TaxID=2202143 RepID=A0A420ZE66_UNCK3|nr:MAG: 50S ribosomal protein L4 [candidate division Kazan bacterium]